MFRHNTNNDVRIYSDRLHQCPRHRPVFLFHSKFQLLEESRCPLRKTRAVLFVDVENCVLQRVYIRKHLEKIYVELTDEDHVVIISLDNPSLLFRNQELEKNIVVKDFQNFMDRQISTDKKTDPLCSSTVFVLKDQRINPRRLFAGRQNFVQ